MPLNFDNLKIVEYYHNNTLLSINSIIYSSTPKNEKLGMLNGDFNEEELIRIYDIIDKNIELESGEQLELTDEVIEKLSELGIIQIDLDEDITDITYNPYDTYFNFNKFKLIILKAPTECNKLKLKSNPEDTESFEVDLVGELYGITEGVYKLIIISQANDEFINSSVYLHENSIDPHSELNIKVLTPKDFYNISNLNEIIESDRVIHIKSNMELGDKELIEGLEKRYSIQSTDDYKLIIV